MAVREVALERISLELFGEVAGDTPVDQEEPLVVIEEGEKLFLVDGFKRFFALRAQGAMAAWVIVKPWSKVQAKLERLRRNNPKRRTTLAEELEILRDLHRHDALSAHAISRAIGKRKVWVARRLEILKRLVPWPKSAFACGGTLVPLELRRSGGWTKPGR